MYITEFELESFCDGTSLRFLDLGNGLNVALTRSDDAAAQLLQVIPGTLFGEAEFFSDVSSAPLAPARRTVVMARTDEGAFRVERRWDAPDPPATITASDGRLIDFYQWDAHRTRVSVAEYADVFTFDVRRLERLLHSRRRTIRELESIAVALHAASSLPQRQARRRASVASPVKWNGLVSRLANLQTHVERALQESAQRHDHVQDRVNRDQLSEDLQRAEHSLQESQGQLANAEAEMHQLRGLHVIMQMRKQLHPLEQELTTIHRRTKRLKSPAADDGPLDRLEERIAANKEEWKAIRAERTEIRTQRKDLEKHRKFDELIPQIEAVLWQEKQLIKEEDALEQLTSRIEDLETRIEFDRLDEKNSPIATFADSTVDASAMSRLDALSDRLRDAERERELADERLAKAEAAPLNEFTAGSEFASSVDSVAIHEAEQRVQRLREQLGWRGDMPGLERERSELQRQLRQLYEGQLLPFGTVLLFGIPFAIGAAMIIHALVSRTGAVNWQQVMWGFIIAFVSILVKIFRDRERDQLLVSVRRKLARVDDRLSQFGDESDADNPALVAELRVAERELQELESQLPKHAELSDLATSRHRDALTVESARRSATDTRERVRDLNQQWRQLMIDLNLSPSLTPAHAREALADRALRQREAVGTSSDHGHQWHLQSLRQELQRRQDWLEHQLTPFRHLCLELGRSPPGETIVNVSEILHEAVRDARDRKKQLIQCQRTNQRLRQKEASIRDNSKRLLEQRRSLRDDLRMRKEQLQAQDRQMVEREKQVSGRRDDLQHQLHLSMRQFSLEPDSNLHALTEDELSRREATCQEEIDALRDHVLNQTELRGQLRAELHRNDLEQQESRLEADSLHPIRGDVEKLQEEVRALTRQPTPATEAETLDDDKQSSEYLQAASKCLRRLSGGQFRALAWRGEKKQLVLRTRRGPWRDLRRVRTAHYANIYFALWLTRLEQYADRGIRFPVILEDPLMVTPPRRQRVIARTLREFAAMGHQMLLVARQPTSAAVFAQLGVPIADLSQRETGMTTTLTSPQAVVPTMPEQPAIDRREESQPDDLVIIQ